MLNKISKHEVFIHENIKLSFDEEHSENGIIGSFFINDHILMCVLNERRYDMADIKYYIDNIKPKTPYIFCSSTLDPRICIIKGLIKINNEYFVIGRVYKTDMIDPFHLVRIKITEEEINIHIINLIFNINLVHINDKYIFIKHFN